MEGTRINDQLDTRLRELIENHVNSLRADFQRLIGELPLQVDEGNEPAGQEPLADTLARLKESVDAIHGSRGQREMAHRLLDAAGMQAARVGLLLSRGQHCVGFEARGFGADGDDAFGSLRLSPDGDDPIRQALEGQSTLHLHGSSLAGSALDSWLPGPRPQQACLAPVVVGGRAVAMLYADSGPEGDGGRIHPEAVEILASVAAMYLERMRRPAEASDSPEVSRHSDAPAPDTEDDAMEAAAVADPGLPVSSLDADGDSDVAAAADPDGIASWSGEQSGNEDMAATRVIPLADSESTQVMVGDGDEPMTFDPAATMAVTDEPVAGPAGSRQDPHLEEDARRFARLLVSEIVLYNEAQVKVGQKNGDLYARLREAIDRSRDAYQDRFGAGTTRFFDEELVSTLAGGEASLLGDGYPGA